MTKKILIAVVLFFLFIYPAECKSPISQAESIDFYPVADMYVYEKSNAVPYNNMELQVGNQNTINCGNIKSALKFDISAIPSDSIINEAYLNVYSFDTKPSWDSRPIIQAYSAPNDWSESSIDWSRLNDVSTQIYASSFIAGLPGSSPDSYFWDITTMVQSWVNGKPNFGIILQYDFKGLNDYITIYSSNNLIFKPYLSVSYISTEKLSTEHSLPMPIKTIKETNDLTVNEPDVLESIIKTKKTKKPTGKASLYPVDPTPLINPTVLNDTLSNPVQTTPQIILPEITRHPQSQLMNPGSPVTFSVSASGVPPLSFQWQKDGVDIDGATSEDFVIDNISENDEGFYFCKVSNDAGSITSADAELMIKAVSAKKNKISESPKKSPFVFKSLLLKPPAGQGLYAHNGDILTYKGIAFPNATLVSANLEDEQGYIIRNVSKGLKIERETGNISGSVFVGSFRGAETVHLKITIQDPSGSQMVTGISNTLFMDQGHPTIQITAPANHTHFNRSPIVIYGTASDDISGIAAVEISTDGGTTYHRVNILRNNQWLYSFTPNKSDTEYKIKVRSTDGVGLSTESDYLTIHYDASSDSVRKVNKTPMRKSSNRINGKTDKSPDDDGICTYRIISLSHNNFQPTDLFTLNEQMAIIVKGYGGKMVTLRIIDPSIDKVLFELSDFIPLHKNKMWKWKLSQTGTFQAALIVDGSFEDDIFFTIIQ